MHKPLATVLDILDRGIKEERLIAHFHHLTAPFDKGGLNRMTIEVVGIFEDFFAGHSIDLEESYPRLHDLVKEKRAEHERSMDQVDAMLKMLNGTS